MLKSNGFILIAKIKNNALQYFLCIEVHVVEVLRDGSIVVVVRLTVRGGGGHICSPY